jgi:hypothetical protein
MCLPIDGAIPVDCDSSAKLRLSESDQLNLFLKQCYESRTGGNAEAFEASILLDDSPEFGLT